MKKFLLLLLTLCLSSALPAQKISRLYRDVPMPEVLRDLNMADNVYTINFMYNDLENFRVTTDIHQKTLEEAIQQVIGFYPIRYRKRGVHEIYVESTHKAKHYLRGAILDEHERPVPYVNIALLSPTDSTLLGGGVSNESGYFAIPLPLTPSTSNSGITFLARFSHIGYHTIYRLCENLQVDTIRMETKVQTIKGVVVNGQVPFLHREAETLIFDASHIIGAINATDLLQYTPGVILNDDAISLFGSRGVILCINGKEQHLKQTDLLQILKSYPADEVEKIEISTSPHTKFSATGNTGVINLIMKKKGHDYIGGSIGYAHTQFQEHGDETNVNIVYHQGKIATSFHVAGRWDNTRYRETNSIEFSNFTRNHTDDGHIKNEDYSTRWQLDYQASNRLTFGTYFLYTKGHRRLDVDGEYNYHIKDANTSNTAETESRRYEKTQTLAFNAYASQQLDEKGTKIDYSMDYYRMKMGDNRTSAEGNREESEMPDKFYYQNHIKQTISHHSAKMDVQAGSLMFGSQFSYARSHRGLDFSWMPNYGQWSDFVYDERIWAAYTEYHSRFGNKLSIHFGGRYEQTWTKGHRQSAGDDTGHRNRCGRFFPSLIVSYQPHQNHSFNWSLSSHINRPNFINVNPDTLCNDIHHSTTGNPNLTPTYLYKTQMKYTYKEMLSIVFHYAYQPNRMAQISYLNNGVTTLTTWKNAINEQNLGINTVFHYASLNWMTALLTQSIWWNKTTGEGQFAHSSMKSWNYTGTLQMSFFFDRKRKWVANLNATYHSPQKDVTKSLESHYSVDIVLQHQLAKDRFTLGLTCHNLLASHIKGTEYLGMREMNFNHKFHYRQLRLTLTYNWGARQKQSHRQYPSDEVKERVLNDF